MEGFHAADVARRFLDILWASPPPSEAELAIAIDRLLAASHYVNSDDEAESEITKPPEHDGEALYDDLAERFPDLGYYSVASPLVLGAGELEAGDAIDDLVFITTELRRVMWIAEHIDAAEAARCFRASESAWGARAISALSCTLGATAGEKQKVTADPPGTDCARSGDVRRLLNRSALTRSVDDVCPCADPQSEDCTIGDASDCGHIS